ncbi:MAG: twin-arginine translocation signal domain-containing protein, partial [Anaerohalosphaera sp.]|nr:twin-arginine translocation signal domain-containing protein [Anaerohalosphaera sp.]
MNKLSRRNFMKGSLATAAGIGVASNMTSSAWGAIRGANDDIRVAIIGINGKGGAHINDFNKIDGVRIVALCDPDSKILADKAKKLAEHK